MTYWTDDSTYIRNPDDLRLLADLVRIHCGSAIGQQIYSIATVNANEVKNPFTFDHNKRPAIIAILIAMIESGNVPAMNKEETKLYSSRSSKKSSTSSLPGRCVADASSEMASMYSNSIKMAAMIADRKSVSPRLNDASAKLSWMLNTLLLAWYRQKKQNSRVMLSADVRLRIQLFAETIIRAAQMYRETLFRNRILWDRTDLKFIGDSVASEFNLAFDMSYIELAITDLSAEDVSTCKNGA